jgi:hypothetical protein
MCSPATCRVCGKTTWTGCGQHVERVMRDVPKARQCPGHQDDPPRGVLARILGR